MPRIPPLISEGDEGASRLAATGIYRYSPSVQEGAQALDAGIGAAGRISPELRQLMNLRVATIVGCPF